MPEYPYIFVNGRVFDASHGVKEFMNGGEIADLVGEQESAVVHLEAGIDPKEVRIDTFASSDVRHSGVRVTHLPSGLVVARQNHKSQAKNRAEAISGLRALLYESGQAHRQRIGIREQIHIQSGNLFSVTSG
jgi:protein subunit release factor A